MQLKQDVVHRLVDVWATGEASAALGFEAARVFDRLDPMERVELLVPRERELGASVEDSVVSEVYTVRELVDAVRARIDEHLRGVRRNDPEIVCHVKTDLD